MTHLAMSTHYDAPIERVFEFATDFAHYPEWNVNYVAVDEVIGPVDQPGTRVHGELKLLGRQVAGWGEIKAVERPRLLQMESTTEDGSTKFVYRFTPDETGTLAEYEFDYELKPGIFGAIADKLFIERSVERDLRHSMENSKAFIEARELAAV
jgi:uncharacterized protein YndB with AHSA1/START domain